MTLGGGLLAAGLGLILGSAANVCIDQLPKKASPLISRPRCRACGSPVPLLHSLPLAGYLIARGRCRSCGHPMLWREPVVEASSGLLAVACYAAFGFTWGFFSKTLLLVVALTAGVIDGKHQIIPNSLTLPCLVAGLALSLLPGRPTPLEAVVGLAVAGGLLGLAAWAYPQGMGGGDVKFMAMAGAFLGWAKALLAIFVASLAGAMVGLTLIGLGRRGRKDPLAFGPFLSLGVLIAVFGDSRWLPLPVWWVG